MSEISQQNSTPIGHTWKCPKHHHRICITPFGTLAYGSIIFSLLSGLVALCIFEFSNMKEQIWEKNMIDDPTNDPTNVIHPPTHSSIFYFRRLLMHPTDTNSRYQCWYQYQYQYPAVECFVIRCSQSEKQNKTKQNKASTITRLCD